MILRRIALRRKAKRVVEVYEDKAGKWRWRVIARNGQEVGRSEQGYARRAYAIKVAEDRNPGLVVRAYTRDRCETCGDAILGEERVEVTEWSPITDPTGGIGGGSVSATYCKAHAPEEAK